MLFCGLCRGLHHLKSEKPTSITNISFVGYVVVAWLQHSHPAPCITRMTLLSTCRCSRSSRKERNQELLSLNPKFPPSPLGPFHPYWAQTQKMPGSLYTRTGPNNGWSLWRVVEYSPIWAVKGCAGAKQLDWNALLAFVSSVWELRA